MKKTSLVPKLPAASATCLHGSVMLNQSSELILQFIAPVGMRWQPSPAGVLHRWNGSQEPVTIESIKRPKMLASGSEVFLAASRASDDLAESEILRLSFENLGVPVEIWNCDEFENRARRRKR